MLMSLDGVTAAELLKGVDPRIVEDLALELSYMDAAGLRSVEQSAAATLEFFSALDTGGKQGKSDFQAFLEEMLTHAVGQERAKQFQSGLGERLRKRDPFLPIRKAELDTLAPILEREHPQAVAVILAELSPRKSSALLGRLSEGVRVSAVSRMTGVEAVSPEAKLRIGEMIAAQIERAVMAKAVGMVPPAEAATPASPGAAAPVPAEQGVTSLRKVGVVIRALEREVRDSILAAIRQKDKDAAEAVGNLMIIWEDLSSISDRSMQEGLRGTDERTLAMAIFEAEESIIRKIKSNISERAAAAVDEEASLVQEPKKKETDEAREKLLHRLRDLHVNGGLTFEEEAS